MKSFTNSSIVLVFLLIGLIIGTGASIKATAPTQSFATEIVAETAPSDEGVQITSGMVHNYFAYNRTISNTDITLECELNEVEVLGRAPDPGASLRQKVPTPNPDRAVRFAAQNLLGVGENNISYEMTVNEDGTRIISMIDPNIVRELRQQNLPIH